MQSLKLLLFLVQAILAVNAFGQNVLINPDFEEEKGWNHWGGVQDPAAHSGKYSLKIHNDEFKWSGSDQVIVLPEGVKRITISGWMKTENVEKGSNNWEMARIAIEFYDEDNKLTGGYPQATGQAVGSVDWRPYKRMYPVPAGAKTVKLQLALGNCKGTAWYDGMEATLTGEGGKTLEAGELKVEGSKPQDFIRLNQLGFYPSAPKLAVIVKAPTDRFFIIDAIKKDTVYRGVLSKKGTWKYSGEQVSQADFTKVTRPGSYYISIPGYADSYTFKINHHVSHTMGKASLKSYYYQRSAMDILEEYAGKWSRKAGHPDNEVLIHSSATSPGRPEGSKISSSRGWYDAGDYNKYIVNSGISTYTLLALHEHYTLFTDTINLAIPESRNQLPDLLDESLYNIRWMLTMQDPYDGGVYHKLTNPNFDGVVMPESAIEPRYVVMKSTAATLDFTAVMAQSFRVFKKYDKQLPGFADSCLSAAKRAYDWAKKNPEVLYRQNDMNEKFKPAVVTGEYGDNNVSDEFQWASIELYASTGDMNYYKAANLAGTIENFGLMAWPNVNTLGLITLINLKDKKIPDMVAIKSRLIQIADEFKNYAATSEFGVPMGVQPGNFVWGSNSVAANQGIILLQAFRLTKKKEYLNAAISCLDYIMGRNGTGYSYVSGFGGKPMRKPHHRPSQADNVKDPVPGFLSGGPNPEQQDKQHCSMSYPSELPAKSYLDEECSYASNEIAINWNSPLTYLVFAIEASMNEGGKK